MRPERLTEGIAAFLRFLKEKIIRTGVISNIGYYGKVVEEKINALLPENDFEFVIATSEYVFRKPNRRIFELALEKAELYPEEVWYVGDQYECDVMGAAGAGIFPVWYIGNMNRAYEKREGVLTVGSWEELQGLLE